MQWEGTEPDLTGIKVEVHFSDNTRRVITDPEEFYTSPRYIRRGSSQVYASGRVVVTPGTDNYTKAGPNVRTVTYVTANTNSGYTGITYTGTGGDEVFSIEGIGDATTDAGNENAYCNIDYQLMHRAGGAMASNHLQLQFIRPLAGIPNLAAGTAGSLPHTTTDGYLEGIRITGKFTQDYYEDDWVENFDGVTVMGKYARVVVRGEDSTATPPLEWPSAPDARGRLPLSRIGLLKLGSTDPVAHPPGKEASYDTPNVLAEVNRAIPISRSHLRDRADGGDPGYDWGGPTGLPAESRFWQGIEFREHTDGRIHLRIAENNYWADATIYPIRVVTGTLNNPPKLLQYQYIETGDAFVESLFKEYGLTLNVSYGGQPQPRTVGWDKVERIRATNPELIIFRNVFDLNQDNLEQVLVRIEYFSKQDKDDHTHGDGSVVDNPAFPNQTAALALPVWEFAREARFQTIPLRHPPLYQESSSVDAGVQDIPLSLVNQIRQTYRLETQWTLPGTTEEYWEDISYLLWDSGTTPRTLGDWTYEVAWANGGTRNWYNPEGADEENIDIQLNFRFPTAEQWTDVGGATGLEINKETKTRIAFTTDSSDPANRAFAALAELELPDPVYILPHRDDKGSP